MQQSEPAQVYDRFYFAHDCGTPYQREERWLRFFSQIADHLVAEVEPKTVLDAGCAMGFLVEALRDRGVEAYGLDVSEFAIRRARPDIQEHLWIGSLTEPLPRRYDLIVCIEVLEHLEPADAERAVAVLCQHSDDLLVSSTPLDYKEITHINVRPPEYWAELLAHNGFVRDVDYDASFIAPWATRFRRTRDPLPRALGSYERLIARLRNQNQGLRELSLEQREELKAQEQRLLQVEEDLHEAQQRPVRQLLKRAARRKAVALFPGQTRRGRALRNLLKPKSPQPPAVARDGRPQDGAVVSAMAVSTDKGDGV